MAETISLDTLVAREYSIDPYYCWPLLPFGGRAVIGAPSKSYKSMLALNMAYDLAEGTPVFGHFPIKQAYSVLIIEQEIGEYRLQERMLKIHGARRGDLAGQNIHFASKDLTVNLHTPDGLIKICAHIEAAKPQIVFFDPLRKLHSKGENSSDDMVAIFRNVEALSQKYGIAVVMVHHTGKPNELLSPDSPHSLRGSSEIFGDTDSGIMMRKPIPHDKYTVQLTFTLRSAEDPPPIKLTLDPETLTFSPYVAKEKTGEQKTSKRTKDETE